MWTEVMVYASHGAVVCGPARANAYGPYTGIFPIVSQGKSSRKGHMINSSSCFLLTESLIITVYFFFVV